MLLHLRAPTEQLVCLGELTNPDQKIKRATFVIFVVTAHRLCASSQSLSISRKSSKEKWRRCGRRRRTGSSSYLKRLTAGQFGGKANRGDVGAFVMDVCATGEFFLILHPVCCICTFMTPTHCDKHYWSINDADIIQNVILVPWRHIQQST